MYSINTTQQQEQSDLDKAAITCAEWFDGKHQGKLSLHYVADGAEGWHLVKAKSNAYPTKEEGACIETAASQIAVDAGNKFYLDCNGNPIDFSKYSIIDFGTGCPSKFFPVIKAISNDQDVVIVDMWHSQLDGMCDELEVCCREAGLEITLRQEIADLFGPMNDFGQGPFFGVWSGLHFGNVAANPQSKVPPITQLINRAQRICMNTKGGVVLIAYNRCLDPEINKAGYLEHAEFNLGFLKEMEKCGLPEYVKNHFIYEPVTTLWLMEDKTIAPAPIASMVSHYAKVIDKVSFSWLGRKFNFEKGDRRLVECSTQIHEELVARIGKNLGRVLAEWHWPNCKIGLIFVDASDIKRQRRWRGKYFNLKADNLQLRDVDTSVPIIRKITPLHLRQLLQGDLTC